jgi:amidohydrolase
MAAKRNLDIMIYGAGGHGSMPHLNIDPIVCAAAVVQSLQTVISRNIDPLDPAILSINMIQGGSPVNLVVDRVLLKATVRSLSDHALDRAIDRVRAIVEKTAEAYECRSEIRWKERIPAVWNAPAMLPAARRCAERTGCALTDAPPSLASEDFALYREFVPSFFFWVGSRAAGAPVEELHTPRFSADDRAIRHAAELYAACASFFN